MRHPPKPLLLALAGCVGIWMGGLAGHLFLQLTWKEPPPPSSDRRALCLVLDVSGSMEGPPLEEVKRATVALAKELDYGRYRLALAVFGNESRLVSPLSSGPTPEFAEEVEALAAEGGTNMNAGLISAVQAMSDADEDERREILLFTDGKPSFGAGDAVALANRLRGEGYSVVCVAAGDADVKYMARLAGSFRRVVRVTGGDFLAAFREAAGLLTGRQLVVDGHEGGAYTFQEGILRIGGWTALLALGIATSLAATQSRLLHRKWWIPTQLLKACGGALALGMIAGMVGQGAYDGAAAILEGHIWTIHDFSLYLGIAALLGIVFGKGRTRLWCSGALAAFAGMWFWSGMGEAFIAFFQEAARILGWIIMATALTVGMGLLIPNYRYSWAFVAGPVAGLVVGILFFGLNRWLSSDTAATWAGITVLGIVIGLLVGLIEMLGADMVAEIQYDNGEKVRVNAGNEIIKLSDGRGGDGSIIISRDSVTGPGLSSDGLALKQGASTRVGDMTITLRKRGE